MHAFNIDINFMNTSYIHAAVTLQHWNYFMMHYVLYLR